MNDAPPEGLRSLYDSFVKVSEFPAESNHNLANLLHWGDQLKALHYNLQSYHDEQYLREYKILMQKIREASKFYPSGKYLTDGYEACFEWLGSLSSLYARLGLLVPENLEYTEGGDDPL